MKYTSIIIKLRKIIRSINLDSKRIEKEFQVSIPQLLTLQYLSEQPDYKAQSTKIKSYLNLNASTMSGIIKRLQSKSLVARLPNTKDKRAFDITLTAKGADLLKEQPMTIQNKLSTNLTKLPKEEIINLEKYIDLLIDLMDAENIDASPFMTTNELNDAKY